MNYFFEGISIRQILTKKNCKIIRLVILLLFFIIFFNSIANDKLYIGDGDSATRLLLSVEYSDNLRSTFNINNWLHVWPPVPFIIQGACLKIFTFLFENTEKIPILISQTLSVILTLTAFYLISEVVSKQISNPAGILTLLICFNSTPILFLAYTSMSEVYSLFFISLALIPLSKSTLDKTSFCWLTLALLLSFFTRNENFLMGITCAIVLFIQKRKTYSLLLLFITIVIAAAKIIGSIIVPPAPSIALAPPKFFEMGKLYFFGNSISTKLDQTLQMANNLFFANSRFLIVCLSCFFLFLLAKALSSCNSLSLFFKKITANSADILVKSPDHKQIPFYDNPLFFWLLFFCLISFGLLSQTLLGNINAQLRYTYAANLFETVSLSIIMHLLISDLFKRKNIWCTSGALIILFVLLGFSMKTGLTFALGEKQMWQQNDSSKQITSFLRKNNFDTDKIVYDFLLYKGNGIAAQLVDSTLKTPEQFHYVTKNMTLLSKIPDNIVNLGDRVSAYFHILLSSNKTKYLVVPTNSYLIEIKKDMLPARHTRPSYFLPYLEQISVDTFLFNSPINKKIILNKIYENTHFILLEKNDLA